MPSVVTRVWSVVAVVLVIVLVKVTGSAVSVEVVKLVCVKNE